MRLVLRSTVLKRRLGSVRWASSRSRTEESEFALEEAISGRSGVFAPDVGEIVESKDGFAAAIGLKDASLNQLVRIENTFGVVIGLERSVTRLALLEPVGLRTGAKVNLASKTAQLRLPKIEFGAFRTIFGRDAWSAKQEKETRNEDFLCEPEQAPRHPMLLRSRPEQQLWTGSLAIDALAPIGLGERVALASENYHLLRRFTIDLIQGLKSSPIEAFIWLAVGGDTRSLRNLEAMLNESGMMERTFVMVALDWETWATQAIAADMAARMAETLAGAGRKNVMVVVDNLSSIARAYEKVEQARSPALLSAFHQPHVYLERLGVQAGGTATGLCLLPLDGSLESEQVLDRLGSQVDSSLTVLPKGIRVVGSGALSGTKAHQNPVIREISRRVRTRLYEASNQDRLKDVAHVLGFDKEEREQQTALMRNLREVFELGCLNVSKPAEFLFVLFLASEDFFIADDFYVEGSIAEFAMTVLSKASSTGLLDEIAEVINNGNVDYMPERLEWKMRICTELVVEEKRRRIT